MSGILCVGMYLTLFPFSTPAYVTPYGESNPGLCNNMIAKYGLEIPAIR